MNARKTGALFLTITILMTFALPALFLLFKKLGISGASVYVQFVMYGIILGVCLIFKFISKEKFSDFFGFKKFKVSVFFLTILFAILIVPSVNIAGIISNTIFGNPLVENTEVFPLPLLIIFTNFCAPFFEEFLFRGAIFHGLRHSGRPWAAILLSALLFGLFHGNVTQFIYASVLGIFLGLIVEASGSLWMSILIHFLLNISGSVILVTQRLQGGVVEYISAANLPYGSGEIIEEMLVPFSIIIYAVALCIAIAIAVFFLFLARAVLRKIAKIQGRSELYLRISEPLASTGRRVWSIPLIIGIGIAVSQIIFAYF